MPSHRLRSPLSTLAFMALLALLALDACAPRSEIPVADREFYVQMQKTALQFPQKDGAWDQHFGDAPYYGTAFYATAPDLPSPDADIPAGTEDHRTRARAAAGHNLATLTHGRDDRSFFLSHLEEVMMSALGLIEYAAATGDRAGLPLVEETIDTIDAVTVGLRYYIDLDAGMFAIKTYGPTAISAGVALLNLQYAKHIGGERAAERIDFARAVIDAIHARAWDGGRYRVKPGDDLMELYPNTMMMLVLCRLYEQTGDGELLARAQTVYDAIQVLRSPRGGYRSPYSAAEMGAQTDDYSTLSSQNYLTMALILLYQDTHNARYFDEALFVLTFIRTHLHDPATGHLLHHFIDGRIARPSDPEYFCTGCNLQFLYVFHMLSRVAGADARPDAV